MLYRPATDDDSLSFFGPTAGPKKERSPWGTFASIKVSPLRGDPSAVEGRRMASAVGPPPHWPHLSSPNVAKAMAGGQPSPVEQRRRTGPGRFEATAIVRSNGSKWFFLSLLDALRARGKLPSMSLQHSHSVVRRSICSLMVIALSSFSAIAENG